MASDPFSNDPERERWAALDRSMQKQLGQFWTPYAAARLMASWLAPTTGPLLDPATGSAVLARALADPAGQVAMPRTVVVRDLDVPMIDFVRSQPALPGLTMEPEVADFFATPAEPVFGGITTNPPYLKQRSLGREFKSLMARAVMRDTGFTVPGLANLYIYFVVRLTAFLAPGGRMSAIVPVEFLDSSAYGRHVKRWLLEQGLLRGVVTFSNTASIFDDASTTAAILLIEKSDPGPDPTVSLVRLADIADCAGLEPALASGAPLSFGRVLRVADLDPDKQWRHIIDGDDLVTTVPTGFRRLGDVVHVRSGASSVAPSRLFVVSEREAVRRSLPREWLRPVMTGLSQCRYPAFRDSDHADLVADGRETCWLLEIPRGTPDDDPRLAAILASPEGIAAAGERTGEWWRQARRSVTPAWLANWWYEQAVEPASHAFGVGNGRVRTVRNVSDTLTLNHVYAVRAVDPAHDEFVIALSLSSWFARLARRVSREYGGGMCKIELGDLREAHVPDPDLVPAGIYDAMRVALRRLDEAAGRDAETAAIAQIDDLAEAAVAAAASVAAG